MAQLLYLVTLMIRLSLVMIALCAACTDSPAEPEVPAIDPDGEHYGWVIDSLRLGTTDVGHTGINLDLSENLSVDNHVGQVLALILREGDYEEQVHDEFQRRLIDGDIIQLLDLQTVDLLDAERVGLLPSIGVDADGDFSNNWQTPADYAVATAGAPAVGTIEGRMLRVRGGRMPLTLALPGVAEPFVLELHAAGIDAEVTPNWLDGYIGGALSEEDIDRVFLPIVHLSIQAMIDDHCEAGVCESGSVGDSVLDIFDANDDGVVTQQEVRDQPLMRGIFEPDVDLFDENGDYNPNVDGVRDSMSFGIAFTAAPANFDLPMP